MAQRMGSGGVATVRQTVADRVAIGRSMVDDPVATAVRTIAEPVAIRPLGWSLTAWPRRHRTADHPVPTACVGWGDRAAGKQPDKSSAPSYSPAIPQDRKPWTVSNYWRFASSAKPAASGCAQLGILTPAMLRRIDRPAQLGR